MPMDRGNNVQALARLPHLNDQQLQQIAMNKADPLSTFAIAALNSRQIQKQKMQAGGGQKPTIADQVLSAEQSQGLGAINPNQPQPQPQPQQMAQAPQPQQAPVQMAEGGVATLDTGDMYNEQNYAGGGIVAFGEGGMADGDTATDAYWAQSAQSDLDTPYLTPSYWYAKTEDMMHRNIFPNRIVGVDAKGKPVTEKQKYGDDPYSRAWKTNKIAERDKWLGKKEADKAAITPPPGMGIPKPNTPYDMTDKDLLAAANENRMNPLIKMGDSMFAPKQEGQKDVGAFPQGTPSGDKTKEEYVNRLLANEGLKTSAPDRSGLFDALIKPTEGFAKKKAGEFMDILGEDPQRAVLQGRLDKMDADLTKDKTMAPWMSLTKAGLAMAAGKSPFALQNIAMGGIEGIKDYTEKQKDLKDAEYKHFALTNDMAKADRAVKIAATQYGVQSEQHQDAQNNAAKLAKANYFVQKDVNDLNTKLKLKELDLSGMKILNDIDFKDRHLSILQDRIKVGDEAAKTKMFQVTTTALKDFHNSRQYNKFLSDLDKQFKYKGGQTNPEYIGAIQQKDIEYLSNVKTGLGMDTGETAIKSYDDLVNPK